MRIVEGFKLRTVMGQPIIVGEGAKQVNFSKMITLNPSAELLWRSIEGKEFSAADLAATLVKEYDIDEATAQADAQEIADAWLKHGLIEA